MGSSSCMNTAKEAEESALYIGNLAYQALLEEVYTSPKPGLVDPYSNGAHTDMNVKTFEKSAAALKPYFITMALEGFRSWEAPPVLFERIRRIGILAERAMYQATEGVNTHKGLIFNLGILCAASGACLRAYQGIYLEQLLGFEQAMVREILTKEVKQMEGFKTGGEKNLTLYGSLGARGEAINGYSSVCLYSLPVLLEGIKEKKDWNLVKLHTLFHLMSQVEDSNIIARHNPQVLKEVKQQAQEFLDAGGAYRPDCIKRLEEMDEAFIKRNISSGGSADLLAVTIFLARLVNEKG